MTQICVHTCTLNGTLFIQKMSDDLPDPEEEDVFVGDNSNRAESHIDNSDM